MDIGAPIDWEVAARTGARVAKEPPVVRADEAAAVEGGLAVAAAHARELAAHTTELPPAADTATMVIDRPGWLRANIETFAHLIDQPAPERGWGRLAQIARGRAAGVEIGALFGWISARVLGQFDPWANRLILVAPNVLEAERRLGLDADDFRLWVSVHEETHRLQFTAAPWLRDHLTEVAGTMVDDLDLRAIVRGKPGAAFDSATATMSVLEGHADVMMDRVGVGAIPSLRRIRRRFDHRRANPGRDKILRKLLGLDLKMEQYRTGAAFCRAVIAKVGVPGLNVVWQSPEHLPSIDELAHPGRWVTRLHG